jgi:hypothetical protein
MRFLAGLAAAVLAVLLTQSAAADGGGRADDVAIADGRVWTSVRGLLSGVDPERASREGRPIRTGIAGTTIASGEGSLWLLDRRTLVGVDTTTARVRLRIRLRHPTYALAVGHGKVWLPSFAHDTLASVDASSGRSRPELPVPHSPLGVAVGAGSVWVASVGRWHKGRGGVMVIDGPGIVSRFSPKTGAATARIKVGRGPTALVVGQGSLWVLCGRGLRAGDSLQRVDLRTNRVVASFRAPHYSAALAVGRRYVWVVSEPKGAGGVVTRLDVAKHRAVSRAIPRSWIPAAVATFGNDVWIADPGVGELIRLNAQTMQVTGRVSFQP